MPRRALVRHGSRAIHAIGDASTLLVWRMGLPPYMQVNALISHDIVSELEGQPTNQPTMAARQAGDHSG